MKNYHIIYSILSLLSFSIIAQTPDTLKLPFVIADEKKLSEEDLANKKEGIYFTAIPDISSDPINGLGLRIVCNVNTVLRFDYAISKEDKQFFFNLEHAF